MIASARLWNVGSPNSIRQGPTRSMMARMIGSDLFRWKMAFRMITTPHRGSFFTTESQGHREHRVTTKTLYHELSPKGEQNTKQRCYVKWMLQICRRTHPESRKSS